MGHASAKEKNILDVIIVGAGLSGIGTAYWLQEKCPGKKYIILEARDTLGVTVVHPGGVNTHIARAAIAPAGVPPEEVQKRREAEQRLLRMPPEQAGEAIVRGIEKNRTRILVGTDAKLISLIERLLPTRYWNILKVLKPNPK